MNSCVLTAQVVEAPKLRYTQDNQTPVADMFVEFNNGRDGEPPARLRVVGWNNLATEIQEQCQVGDRITIQGRLQMSTVDRPEGFKEKRAELVASRLYRPDGAPSAAAPAPAPSAASTATAPSNIVPMPSAPQSAAADYSDYEEAPPKPAKTTQSKSKAKAKAAPEPPPVDDTDLDDIPF